jgi:hypothetical protein
MVKGLAWFDASFRQYNHKDIFATIERRNMEIETISAHRLLMAGQGK